VRLKFCRLDFPACRQASKRNGRQACLPSGKQAQWQAGLPTVARSRATAGRFASFFVKKKRRKYERASV